MQISNLAIEKIKGNNQVMGRMCSEFDKHMKTIESWIAGNNIMLTTALAIQIIKEETGLSESEILVTEKAIQA